MKYSEGLPVALENEKEQKSYKSAKDSVFLFSSKDVSLEDDGFHGSTASRFTEWWYFDVVCNHGYSVQMSVRVASIIKNRFVLISQRLTVYNDGGLLRYYKKSSSLKNSELFNEYPLVKLDGKKVINGKVGNDGKWVYALSFHGKNVRGKLQKFCDSSTFEKIKFLIITGCCITRHITYPHFFFVSKNKSISCQQAS